MFSFKEKRTKGKKRVSKRQLAIKAKYPNNEKGTYRREVDISPFQFIEEISEGIPPLSISLNPTISAIDEDIVNIRNGLWGQFIWF